MKRLMALGTATLALLLSGCERSLIYYPTHTSEERLLEVARRQGLVPWRNERGERIGWQAELPASAQPRTAVVVFHGNAGQAVDRSYFARGFRAAIQSEPWAVYVLEYPGYGSRPGRPSETAIKEAAREAVQALAARDFDHLYVLGESLGGGVACDIAATSPERVTGLLLLTPFTSLLDLARHHYPNWLVRMLLSERYDNVEALQNYRGPVAVLLAGDDEVVPADLGRQLYAAYTGPKKLWVQDGRTHNTLSLAPSEPWWREVTEFLVTSRRP